MQPGDSHPCKQPHACVHTQHRQGHPGTQTSPRGTMLGWCSGVIPACASPGWCPGFKVFQPGPHTPRTGTEQGSSPGPPRPGHLGALRSHPGAGRGQTPATASANNISLKDKQQSGWAGGTFPLTRKGNQGGKGAGHPAGLCQASNHYSGPQGLGRCSVLSVPKSSSHLFLGDGGRAHPSNTRPMAAWGIWGSSWLEVGLSKTHPRARTCRGTRRGTSDSRDCGTHVNPWSQTHHVGAGGSVGAKHHCRPQREAQHSQPCVQVPLLLLPPPSPGGLQPPGPGEVLKM